MTTGARGERISAAKRGRPLVPRAATEITRQEAVRETGLSAKVLLEGAKRQLRSEDGENVRPGLRHRRIRHANGGEVILFDRAKLVEDLARLPCLWCDQPAPGDSGRCRRHQAKKFATVELICEWKSCPRNGEPFTRYGSWLREREGRGRFCSDACQLAWQRASDHRFGAAHPPFDAAFALQRYARLDPQFAEAKAELGLPLDIPQLASATHTSPSVIRAHYPELGGQVLTIEGAQRIALPGDAAERYVRAWAGRPHVDDDRWRRNRQRYLDAEWMVKREVALGRLDRREDERAFRTRLAARRKLLTSKRKGRRPRGAPPAKHFQWERRFSDQMAFALNAHAATGGAGRPPSNHFVAGLIACEIDAQDYTGAEFHSAAKRVWKAVKAVRAWRADSSHPA